jgi:hypothetical protein
MTGEGGVIKRTYDMVALFVLLNVLGVGALAGYLVSTGIIDGETMRTIGMVLKGDELVPVADDEAETAEAPDTGKKAPAARPGDIDNADPQAQMEIELLRRESERVQVELDQRLKLINSILLRVENERKDLKRERAEAEKQDAAETEQRRDGGFEKQIAIFDALSPKVAVQHLLGMNNPQEAAKILIALDTDTAKKIVEAARRGDDMMKMQEILTQLRDAAPSRSAELQESRP